ncbi:MAG TPA: CRISPR-associated endoribonuclease Cas6 [Cytophagales bacterium]|nr:CRISPR-associated endoribonuclease Cas6 [Cytophagales bacterium]
MRVRIIFSVKNRGAILPFHHQNILTDFIKETLAGGMEKSFIEYPFYNFSGLKGQTKISKKGLHYTSQKTTLVLSSPSQEFIDHFLFNLFKNETVRLGELILSPLSVEKEEAVALGDAVKYVCISPIVIINPCISQTHNPKGFILPDNDLFSDLLYDSTMIRMEKSGVYSNEQIASFFKFQIVPDKEYLNKIKSEEKKFARIYTIPLEDNKYEVRGYTFPFTLYAAPEVQYFLYNCGLGIFADRGFGMVDLATLGTERKTEKYFF